MVVAIIVLVWVVVLGVFAVRRISDHHATSSVERFRSQNRTLGRVPYLASSVPPLGTPAPYRDDVRRRPRRNAAELSAESFIAKARAADRRARKRRTLCVLVGGCLLTLVFGAIPALRFLWAVCIASFVLTVAYIYLLAYFARIEALSLERMRKVVPLHLAPPVPSESADERQIAVAGQALRPGMRALPPVRAAFVVLDSPS